MEVSSSKREEAIRLRSIERLGVAAIAKKLGISKSTASCWLRGHALTLEERSIAQSSNGLRMGGWNKKERGERSKFSSLMNGVELDNGRKGRIAEAAVLFRLALHGFQVHGSAFDGSRSDWIVENPASGRLSKIQVRWTREGDHGMPYVSLKCFEGHSSMRRLRTEECDFIVGYDLYTDMAYVWALASLEENTSTITVNLNALEKWDIIP